jgi:flagellar assembly protein FliH
VSKIIPSDKINNHKVEKFTFGSLKNFNNVEKVDIVEIFSKKEKVEKSQTNKQDEPKEQNSKDYIELLEKVDDLTSEVIELQMKFEEQKKEYEKRLIEVKEEAYNQGVKDIQEAHQEELDSLKVQYTSSITNLQELKRQIKQKLFDFEEELIETSIIIASEIIKKEVEENSRKMARSVANYLLSDIKDELEIKLLVNPKDYEELLKDSLKENIKVIPDNSVAVGGVILLSRDKSLDGTIKSRSKKTLQLVKES